MNDMMHKAAAEIARFRGDAEVARLRLVAAQGEIERLRNGASESRETVCPHVRGTVTQYCSLNFTLTDDEREAIGRAAMLIDYMVIDDSALALNDYQVLRGLYERTQ